MKLTIILFSLILYCHLCFAATKFNADARAKMIGKKTRCPSGSKKAKIDKIIMTTLAKIRRASISTIVSLLFFLPKSAILISQCGNHHGLNSVHTIFRLIKDNICIFLKDILCHFLALYRW